MRERHHNHHRPPLLLLGSSLVDHLPSTFQVFQLVFLILSILVTGFDDVAAVSAAALDSASSSLSMNEQELKPLNVNDLLGQIVDTKPNEEKEVKTSRVEDGRAVDDNDKSRFNNENNEMKSKHAPHRHHNKPVIISYFFNIRCFRFDFISCLN